MKKKLFRSLENNMFSPLLTGSRKKCLIDTCLEVDKSEPLLGGRQRSNRHLFRFPLWYHNVKSRASSSIYYFCWVGWQDRDTNCFLQHWLTKCYITCIFWLYFFVFFRLDLSVFGWWVWLASPTSFLKTRDHCVTRLLTGQTFSTVLRPSHNSPMCFFVFFAAK